MDELQVISSDFFAQTLSVQFAVADFLSREPGTWIYSDNFSAEFCAEQFKWRIGILPNVGALVVGGVLVGEQYEGQVGVALCSAANVVNRVIVSFDIAVLDNERQVVAAEEYENRDYGLSRPGEGVLDHKLVTRDQLKGILTGGALVVRVTLTFVDPSYIVVVPAKKLRRIQDRMPEGDFDIVAKSSGKLIRVNRQLLSLYWPYFKAMVESEMPETSKNSWKVDYDYETMRAIVSYVYTGGIRFIDFHMAYKVLHAAHQFQVDGLANQAVSYYVKKLNRENVLEVLKTAELLGMDQLKESCFDLIAKEEFKRANLIKFDTVGTIEVLSDQYLDEEKRTVLEFLSKDDAALMTSDLALRVIKASLIFDVKEMCDSAIEHLLTNLQVEDVFQVLIAANKGQVEPLKRACFELLLANKKQGNVVDVSELDGFQSLREHPTLCLQLMKMFFAE